MDFIYRSINMESLVVGMNTDKDIELARVCFNIVNHFSTQTKLQHKILGNIPRLKKYIFECLSDFELKPSQKVECLELTQFLVSDYDFFRYSYEHDIENLLVKILNESEGDEVVLSIVLKTFIVLHASSVFNDMGVLVGSSLK